MGEVLPMQTRGPEFISRAHGKNYLPVTSALEEVDAEPGGT